MTSQSFKYPSGEQGRDGDHRSLHVRQHYSSPVQRYQTQDYRTGLVSVDNQIISKSLAYHKPQVIWGSWRSYFLFRLLKLQVPLTCGYNVRDSVSPVPWGRRSDVAVTQLDERQAGSLRRPLAANWVGAGRALQDSPGVALGALGCILDKHQCSQHTVFGAGRKACLLWSWIS